MGGGTAEDVCSPGQMEHGFYSVLHYSGHHRGDQQQRHLYAAHAHPVQSGQYSLGLNHIYRTTSMYSNSKRSVNVVADQ